jgi:spore maturation protein CgeB
MTHTRQDRLLLVGNPGPEHVGSHLYKAAVSIGMDAAMHDVRLAENGPRWAVAAAWRFDRRPLRLRGYGKSLLQRCAEFQPPLVLCVGIAPVSREVLLGMQKMGIRVFNYLTDDPWNPGCCPSWFLAALRYFDHVFSPRRANLEDLQRHGCPAVSYLPFAYDEEAHLGSLPTVEDNDPSRPDIVFVGGADSDRVPFMTALLQADFNLELYGGYWERYTQTRRHAGGHISPLETQRITAHAKIALCLVRRANRDGHVMRSLEIPAMGGCMLAESTAEHRDLFGDEGQAVLYFHNIPELIQKTRWLLDHPEERQRLREAVHRLITTSRHTYRDRLRSMLACLAVDSAMEREHTRMGTDR